MFLRDSFFIGGAVTNVVSLLFSLLTHQYYLSSSSVVVYFGCLDVCNIQYIYTHTHMYICAQYI